MKTIISLTALAALTLSGCGGNNPSSTTASPTGEATSPPAAAATGEECKLISEADIEAIVGTDVKVEEGSCSFKPEPETGLSGTWSVDAYSAPAWTGAKGAINGEAQSGYGDEAYIRGEGSLAQMAVKKGDKILILTVGDPAGKARDLMLKLADKIVAAL